MSTIVDLIYKLENIDAEGGIDVFEIAPILMKFGELIRSANTVLGYEQNIDIRIKPFTEGSWITEFVFESTYMSDLLNYLNSKEGADLAQLLAFLGLSVKDGIIGVVNLIRFTKGKVGNYRKDGSKFIYANDKGEEISITLPEHQLVQSPLIQNNYYDCVIAPLEKFPQAEAVKIISPDKEQLEQTFTRDDVLAFDNYRKQEMAEEVEEVITELNGVLLKPKRGSYSGREPYSFLMGDSVFWPVSIDDALFTSKLSSGDVRLYAEDILKVNLKLHQKKDRMNKINVSYTITQVIDYIKFEPPNQMHIEDFNGGK